MNKIKFITKLLALSLIPLFIIFFIWLVYDPFSDCPMKFRFEFETHCWLRDERQGVKLIELFNVEDNNLWLAKVSKNITWIEHPSSHLDSYKQHISENIIKFSDDNLDMLLVNGEKYPVKNLPSRPNYH